MVKTTKISFAGDIMCDEMMSYELERYYDKVKEDYDFTSVFEPVQKYFSKSDYVFANLETPLSKNNSNLTKKQYEFCSSIEFAKALHDAGVDCVAAANNHCMDRDYDGIKETINCLKEIGLKYAGIYDIAQSFEPCIISVNNLKLGFLSYTYGTNAFSNRKYLSLRNRKAVNLLQEQEEDKLLFRWIYRFIYEKPNNFFSRIYRRIRNKIIKKPIYERRNIDLYRRYLLKKDISKLKKKM